MRTAALAVIMLGLCLSAAAGCGDDDSDTADAAFVEQLIDDFHTAWVESDLERIPTFFTEDGLLTNTLGQPSVGRDEIMALAESFAQHIEAVRRTSPVEARDDGTFVFSEEYEYRGMSVSGERVVTMQDGLFASYEWAEGRPT